MKTFYKAGGLQLPFNSNIFHLLNKHQPEQEVIPPTPQRNCGWWQQRVTTQRELSTPVVTQLVKPFLGQDGFKWTSDSGKESTSCGEMFLIKRHRTRRKFNSCSLIPEYGLSHNLGRLLKFLLVIVLNVNYIVLGMHGGWMVRPFCAQPGVCNPFQPGGSVGSV